MGFRAEVTKLLGMLPTEDEVGRIQEAQEAQPEVPLGTAEQFLLTLASVGGLEARLRLWAFKMEFEVIEREVCEPLMDLKTGIEGIRKNGTFRYTSFSIACFVYLCHLSLHTVTYTLYDIV